MAFDVFLMVLLTLVVVYADALQAALCCQFVAHVSMKSRATDRDVADELFLLASSWLATLRGAEAVFVDNDASLQCRMVLYCVLRRLPL